MHEVGLMTQALDLAAALASERGARTIHRMVLRVGACSGVDADALRLAFDAASPGTLAEQAALEIEEVATRCWCAACRDEFEPATACYRCPRCGAVSSEVRRGDELELATLEVS